MKDTLKIALWAVLLLVAAVYFRPQSCAGEWLHEEALPTMQEAVPDVAIPFSGLLKF
jgi:hypothetical protein